MSNRKPARRLISVKGQDKKSKVVHYLAVDEDQGEELWLQNVAVCQQSAYDKGWLALSKDTPSSCSRCIGNLRTAELSEHRRRQICMERNDDGKDK